MCSHYNSGHFAGIPTAVARERFTLNDIRRTYKLCGHHILYSYYIGNIISLL